MKNIHILSTDKPSRLVKQKYDTLDRLCLADIATKRAEYKRFNIYITSDEEIKEGDWYIDDGNQIRKSITSDKQYWSVRKDYKKIILTTDQDLIKDGVQAIDDEFLGWFVKNPSCEFVEVVKDKIFTTYNNKLDLLGNVHIIYKIIIPKEEPKQETLEEVAERLYPLEIWTPEQALIRRLVFVNGAKWQQERSYSEEEVENLIRTTYEETMRAMIDWFTNNKDKTLQDAESAIDNYVYPRLAEKGIKFKKK